VDIFNSFDIVLLVLLTVLALRGFLSGFLKELSSSIGIIGGIYFSSHFSYLMKNVVHEYMPFFGNDKTIGFVSFLFTLILFIFSTKYLIMIVSNVLLKYEALSSGDRIAGVAIALVKNFAIISIILYSFSNIDFIKKWMKDKINNSHIYPIAYNVGGKIAGKLFEDMKVDNTSLGNIVK